MSSNNNQNNKKIIQFKDIISILLVILIISLSICSVLANSYTVPHNTVTARNLAMFASLAYADLENIETYADKLNLKSKTTLNLLTEIKSDNLTFDEIDMVTDEQLRNIQSNTMLLGIPLSDEKENTYDYLFYGLASTDEIKDWKIVNYTKFDTTVAKGTAQFAAMTFKKDNDIVIAYRGTDFDDIGDWLQDICYGLVGYAGQEGVTQDYAKIVAEYYTRNNNDVHIYVTGHSLGGYLAQIGGAALASDKNYVDNLKEISYFNGMGLKFWSNIVKNISSLTQYKINNTKLKELKSDTSHINTIQNNAKYSLTNFKNNGGTVNAYHINGDIVSSLGTHIGTKIGYDAHNICINHHNGNQSTTKVANEIEKKLTKGLFKIISPFLNDEVSKYIDKYSPSDLLDYVWITHETDSFFGVLPYEDGSLPASINIELSVPSKIKRNKTANATLTVTTIGGSLKDSTLKTNNFVLSNKASLKLTSVSKPVITKQKNGYKYVYTLRLKGGSVIGISKLNLKANVLTMNINNDLCTSEFSKTKNNIITAGYINTKIK